MKKIEDELQLEKAGKSKKFQNIYSTEKTNTKDTKEVQNSRLESFKSLRTTNKENQKVEKTNKPTEIWPPAKLSHIVSSGYGTSWIPSSYRRKADVQQTNAITKKSLKPEHLKISKSTEVPSTNAFDANKQKEQLIKDLRGILN
jgi:hypothetical protein